MVLVQVKKLADKVGMRFINLKQHSDLSEFTNHGTKKIEIEDNCQLASDAVRVMVCMTNKVLTDDTGWQAALDICE